MSSRIDGLSWSAGGQICFNLRIHRQVVAELIYALVSDVKYSWH